MVFECHVTIDPVPYDKDELVSLAKKLKWKTSQITDDPLLGLGNKFYFTTHHADYSTIERRMNDLCFEIGRLGTYPIRRKKIEKIVFDSGDLLG